jgi:hypothetical protein
MAGSRLVDVWGKEGGLRVSKELWGDQDALPITGVYYME